MASADFSRELPQEISPSKVRNLSARAARLDIHCLSVSLDFALMRMFIAQCLPQNRFVFLRSCFCLPLPSAVASRQLPCGSLRFITLFPVSSFQKTRLRPGWAHAFPRRSVGTSILNCRPNTVSHIMHQAVQRGLEHRDLTKQTLHHLSIDEKVFHKGHHYISVLSNPETGNIIDVSEHRTLSSCEQLLCDNLTFTQRQQVKTISLDMWRAYESIAMATIHLPNALQILDKFHLIKYLNEAIDKVRRRECKETDKRALLNKSRYALLKNPHNLTETQQTIFNGIAEANLNVSKAWCVRENFKSLFQHTQVASKDKARALFQSWYQQSTDLGIREINHALKKFNTHAEGVINALILPKSNAMAERLNGKIQILKTIGRGYRTFKNFRSAILFFYGGA